MTHGALSPELFAQIKAIQIRTQHLVTEMVKEFTELQGKIGGIYAREEGRPEIVWQAIYDHYLPVNLDDALPRSTAGAVLSIADKMDTLAGFFAGLPGWAKGGLADLGRERRDGDQKEAYGQKPARQMVQSDVAYQA